jgi:hypothetical protein
MPVVHVIVRFQQFGVDAEARMFAPYEQGQLLSFTYTVVIVDGTARVTCVAYPAEHSFSDRDVANVPANFLHLAAAHAAATGLNLTHPPHGIVPAVSASSPTPGLHGVPPESDELAFSYFVAMRSLLIASWSTPPPPRRLPTALLEFAPAERDAAPCIVRLCEPTYQTSAMVLINGPPRGVRTDYQLEFAPAMQQHRHFIFLCGSGVPSFISSGTVEDTRDLGALMDLALRQLPFPSFAEC